MLKWPRIVFLALRGTSGISLCNTEGEASAAGCAGRSEGREAGGEIGGLGAADFAVGERAETSGDHG
jgi:hypothetical protein